MSESGRQSLPADVEPLPGATSGLHAEISGRREVPELSDPRAELGEVPDWMGRGAWVLSGALASALVLALVIWEPDRYAQPAAGDEGSEGLPEDGPSDDVVGAIAPTIVGLAEAHVVSEASVERDGVQLAAGAAVHENDVLSLAAAGCILVEPEIRICAVNPSVIHVASLARGGRVVEVERGSVVSWPRSGTKLVMRHEGLRASSGTAAFGMAVLGEDQVQVWAARGRVDVTRQPDSADIHGGEGLRWSETKGLTPYRPTMAQFRAPWLARKASERPLARPGTSGRADATDEDAIDGEAELAALGLTPEQASGELEAEMASGELAAGLEGEDVAPDEATTSLADAEAALKNEGAAVAQAALSAVIERFPSTQAARRAALLLGDLRLEKLEDAMGALGAYRTFMADAPSGDLDARARLGAIAALERLNRYAHERKAIEDFLERYPGRREVPRLKARRRLLGGS